MDNSELFSAALMLQKPWKVIGVEFQNTDDNSKELHIYLDFDRGSVFPCPAEGCKESCKAYDCKDFIWRHLNFFQYKTFIHAPLPRTECKEHGIHRIAAPWARQGSGFTLLFESWVLELAKHMPVKQIAEMAGEHDTRLWRFIIRLVEDARAKADYGKAAKIGVDETSRKGHSYITVFMDIVRKCVMFVAEGKDEAAVKAFREDFEAHGGKPKSVNLFTSDMSRSFANGVTANFPNAERVIDKFHVVKNANDALDKVRRDEAKQNPALKKTKYIWLKNEDGLTEKQAAKRESLSKLHLKTSRAYAMKLALQDIYERCQTRSEAEGAMKGLYWWLSHSRLEPMKKFGATLKEHMAEILNYFDNRYTNAILEGTNSVIQSIKCRAHGFRVFECFRSMIYLVCGKLDFSNVLGVAACG